MTSQCPIIMPFAVFAKKLNSIDLGKKSMENLIQSLAIINPIMILVCSFSWVYIAWLAKNCVADAFRVTRTNIDVLLSHQARIQDMQIQIHNLSRCINNELNISTKMDS